MPHLPKFLFMPPFVFNGLDKNSRQPIDCKRFIAIHASHKDLRVRFLHNYADLHEDPRFQRTYEAGGWNSPEPLAAVGNDNLRLGKLRP